MNHRLAHRGLVVLGLLLFVGVWLKIAWACDDAYINFRSLEQFQAGNGPIWNPHARVQAYTSVAWYWLQVPLRAVSGDVFLNSLALSLACMVGLLAVTRRLVGQPVAWLALVVWMVGARGFMDYTSSGLENPLIFLMTALLLGRYLAAAAADTATPEGARATRQLAWMAGLAVLVRHDMAVLWALPVAQQFWRHGRRWSLRNWAAVLLPAAAPLLLWTLFSVFYYGSPWPNSALAKIDGAVAPAVVWAQGLRYLLAMRVDPVLALVLGAGCVVAWRDPRTRALALGMGLHLAYLVSIGGDFMLGRMLGSVFLVAAIVAARALAAAAPRWSWPGLGAGALLAVALPVTPLNTPLQYQNHGFIAGIADERGYYSASTSLWERLRTPGDRFPVHDWTSPGRCAAADAAGIADIGNIGFFGHRVGLETIVIDRFAITDPLLARIPTPAPGNGWRPGHTERPVPDGYTDSLLSGRNQLVDPDLRALYDDVRLATEAPLMAPGRAGAIWRLLTGHHG